MIKRAKRLEPIRGFGIDRVAAAADLPARANERWPVLRMENLDTDLPLPPEAVGVTARSLETPEANSWLPFTGDIHLRKAIAAFLAGRTGHPFDPEREIVITCGGMEGLLNSLLVTVDPGDEVIVTDPTYAGIVNRIHLVDGVPKLVPFLFDEGAWRLDRDALAAAVGDSTAGMLLMSPSMPSGGTFDADDWELICDLCRDRDLFLIYDSAMERLLFDDRPLIHPLHHDGMAERTIVVGSLSKEHRMIGWRVGWVAGPAETIEDAGWAHVYNTTTPVGLARAAAAAVLRGQQDHVAACVAELERRRDTMLAGLPDWP
ncbi:MAG: pyridoxal phosphate-dependent aminotransferase, partial [Gaiellaceae bacterium]